MERGCVGCIFRVKVSVNCKVVLVFYTAPGVGSHCIMLAIHTADEIFGVAYRIILVIPA